MMHEHMNQNSVSAQFSHLTRKGEQKGEEEHTTAVTTWSSIHINILKHEIASVIRPRAAGEKVHSVAIRDRDAHVRGCMSSHNEFEDY
jgi:hypothetical protein